MADNAPNATDVAWTTIFEEYQMLTLTVGQNQPHEAKAIERRIAELQEHLLDTPAPHLTGVRQKLEMLFEGQMDGLDPEAEARRLVVEDFEHLIQAQHQLLGV